MDHRFEELKRYNISEIFDPTPKEEAVKVEDKAAEVSAEAKAKAEEEVVPTVAATTAEDKSGAADTDEVSVDDNDKAVEGDGGVSLANDDATG